MDKRTREEEKSGQQGMLIIGEAPLARGCAEAINMGMILKVN
jgi:hypothetical protein